MIGQRSNELSEVTRELLAQGESEHLDFKRNSESISADDLVAFANTDGGGTILVGVTEERGKADAQRGYILGCDVSDGAILQVINKAVSCVPPINSVVHVENLSEKPIIRLTIPDSENKPHCTPKGNYCRRDGNRNRALHPSEMLKIFLEKEARTFTDRFESAAERVATDLAKLEKTLEASIESMSDQLGWADYKLGDTENTLDTLLGQVNAIGSQTKNLDTRIRALFRQDKREDPVRIATREEWLKEAIEYFTKNPTILNQMKEGAEISAKIQGTVTVELNENEIREAILEAARIARENLEAKKYKFTTKRPSNATEEELNNFASLVEKGGEVMGELRQRMESALILGFLTYENKLVGTAALKRPADNYRAGVFEKSKSGQAPKSYPYELGWIYLEEIHRGTKRIGPLIAAIMDQVKTSGVFATSRALNIRMKSLLAKHGFLPEGTPYDSQQSPGEALLLFLRTSSQPERASQK